MEPTRKAYFLFYLALTALFSVLICFNAGGHGQEFGFWRRLLATVLSIPTGFIGALLGDMVRRFALPDAIFTTGGLFAILRAKFFWLCVPQLVGLILGVAIVAGKILR